MVIYKALSGEHEVCLAQTTRRGHATRLAHEAASAGLDVVVVLGGDGTVNEVANGLAGSSCALGVLPGGSTNVFARTLGMAADPIESASELLEALARRSIAPLSLGRVNDRYFCFHVGLGFDAAVVAQVERRAVLKRYFGGGVFVLAALATWFGGYDRRQPWFTTRVLTAAELQGREGGEEKCSAGALGGTSGDRQATGSLREGYFAICLKSNPYTYFGDRPLDVAPGTGFSTGLSLLTFTHLNLGLLARVLLDAARGGTRISAFPGVELDRQVGALVIDARRPLPYQVDGEYLGRATRFELSCVPEALCVVAPEPKPISTLSQADLKPTSSRPHTLDDQPFS